MQERRERTPVQGEDDLSLPHVFVGCTLDGQPRRRLIHDGAQLRTNRASNEGTNGMLSGGLDAIPCDWKLETRDWELNKCGRSARTMRDSGSTSSSQPPAAWDRARARRQ